MLKPGAIGELAALAGRTLCRPCWDLHRARWVPACISEAVTDPVLWLAVRIWPPDQVMRWYFLWLLDFATRNGL